MANVTGASLTPIYERLRDMPTHHPVSADTFSDWSLEAGDTVTISRDGQTYRSPVHTSTLTWKGKAPMITVNSTGNERRDAVSKVSRKKYNSGGAGMRNNQGLYNDVWSEDGHVHSVISQTASSLTMYVNDKYNQMTSGLSLTSSSAALYVNDRYNQMSSGLKLTSSSAALYVDNKYTQMRSGLSLTSSSAALYVDNKYEQMRAGLSLTSSSAAIYVRSETSAANIVAKINADGTSSALIQADHIKLDGNTRINDVIGVTSSSSGLSSVTIKSNAVVMGTSLANMINFTNGKVSAHGFAWMGPGSTYTEVDGEAFLAMIKTASVSNNILTLTRWDGTTVTFSKATSLSGTWSGNGKLTVTASPQGETFERLLQAGTQSGNQIPINAVYGASGQYVESTGFYVTVPSYVSRLLRCTGVEQTYPGSTTYKYTFTIEGNYSFNEGTNYTMYRTSW